MNEYRQRFEATVLPHLDAAYRLARWLAHSPADADDVVQDAVLRAYRGFDSLSGQDAKAWFLVIVRNCHRSAERARRRRPTEPFPEESDTQAPLALMSGAPGPEAEAAAADERGALGRRYHQQQQVDEEEPRVHVGQAAPGAEEGEEGGAEGAVRVCFNLLGRPEDHREVLVLREIEDLSYREIAEVIGAPIGTVMSRLARARGALQSLWRQGQGAAHAVR